MVHVAKHQETEPTVTERDLKCDGYSILAAPGGS